MSAACILDCDSPSYPPSDYERIQCGCAQCSSDVLAKINRLERELAAAQKELTFHSHRCEAAHNARQVGLPQGDCECPICAPFYKELTAQKEDTEHLRRCWNNAQQRIASLELSLAAIGDLAVADWNSEVVGRVDAVVKDPAKYKDQLRTLFSAVIERDLLRAKVNELLAHSGSEP